MTTNRKMTIIAAVLFVIAVVSNITGFILNDNMFGSGNDGLYNEQSLSSFLLPF